MDVFEIRDVRDAAQHNRGPQVKSKARQATMTSACSRVWGSELETAPESVRWAGSTQPLLSPLAVSCRGSRRAGGIALSTTGTCTTSSCSFAFGHLEFSKGRVNFGRIHSVPGIIITTYITFLLRQQLGLVACTLVTACLVCLGVRRCLDMEPGYGTDPEGDKQPTPRSAGKPSKRPSKSASAASHLPSPDIRTSHSFPIHHLSSFVRSLIFLPYSSLSPFPHLART